MDLNGIHEGSRIILSDERKATVVSVFPESGVWKRNESDKRGIRRKPRVMVKLEDKPTMLLKVAASNVEGLA